MDIKLNLRKFSLRELIEMKKKIDKHIKFKMSEDKIRIDHCDISARVYNSLSFNGIFYLEDLSKMSIKEFSELKNVGKYTVSVCTELLQVHGMNWRVGQREQLVCNCQGCGEVKVIEYCEKCYAENLPDILN